MPLLRPQAPRGRPLFTPTATPTCENAPVSQCRKPTFATPPASTTTSKSAKVSNLPYILREHQEHSNTKKKTTSTTDSRRTPSTGRLFPLSRRPRQGRNKHELLGRHSRRWAQLAVRGLPVSRAVYSRRSRCGLVTHVSSYVHLSDSNIPSDVVLPRRKSLSHIAGPSATLHTSDGNHRHFP